MSLERALEDRTRRRATAAEAVTEAEAAVRSRTGLAGLGAQIGLETINRLRPGFLERHVHSMLPDMARVIDPIWSEGVAAGDARAHLEANAHVVAEALLEVADEYVATATDSRAIGVYHRLRHRAPDRVVEHMPRIASFVERHATPDS